MNSFFFLVIIVLIFLLKCIVVCLPDHDPEGDGVATHGAVVFFFFEDKVASLISKDDYNPSQAVLVHRLGIHDATPQTSPY